MIAKVEAKFASGQQNYKAGHLEAARKDFDEAMDLMLESGRNPYGDPKLSELFHRVVDTVYIDELQAFRAGDGFQEAPAVPAPIDEVAEMTFPVDPRLKERAEQAAKNISHDLPLTVNDEVLSFLNFFQTPRGRAIVETGLQRRGRYQEMISRVLHEEGVPQDLVYLAQAESAFQPLALSRAGARGMWQFVAYRGQQYGLRHTWWIDERQDPEKATRAAAQHLRDLYGLFGDWYLAIAAYNCGPGNVQKAIERTGYADFWELYKRNVLPKETKNYVPIILALTLIAKDAAHYGIQVAPETPVATDVVKPGRAIQKWSIFGIVPLVESGLLCHIAERSVAIVVIQRVAVDAGDKDVGVSVVVVVADGNTNIKPGALQSGSFGYVGERPVAVIAKEMVRVLRRRLFQRGDVRAIGEENVGTSIAVVIKNRDASGHRLRNILGRALAAVETKGQLLQLKTNGRRRWLFIDLLLRLRRHAQGQDHKGRCRELDGSECEPAHAKGKSGCVQLAHLDCTICVQPLSMHCSCDDLC